MIAYLFPGMIYDSVSGNLEHRVKGGGARGVANNDLKVDFCLVLNKALK